MSIFDKISKISFYFQKSSKIVLILVGSRKTGKLSAWSVVIYGLSIPYERYTPHSDMAVKY